MTTFGVLKEQVGANSYRDALETATVVYANSKSDQVKELLVVVCEAKTEGISTDSIRALHKLVSMGQDSVEPEMAIA